MPHRRLVGIVRANIVPALLVGFVLALVAIVVGFFAVASVSADLKAQQTENARLAERLLVNEVRSCHAGNRARAQIRLATGSLRAVLAVVLADPPAPGETARQRRIRLRFEMTRDRLAAGLAALRPRTCTRDAVTGGSAAPAQPKTPSPIGTRPAGRG